MIRTIGSFFAMAALLLGRIHAVFFGFEQLFANNTPKDYQFYWNVPTFMCHQYGMHFEEVSRDFGILQNKDDKFRGEEVAILYDPGLFPALLKYPNGTLFVRNGGVPQQGNLTRHLQVFREHLEEQISDPDFRGLGVIDFESWRPIFRQNWASLAPYRDLSLEIEAKKHPFWDRKSVQREAVREFERAGRIFVEETLRAATVLRPRATWGYYAYPYCFNLTPQQPSARCDPKVLEDNDRMSWLFDNQKVLLPSVYLRMSLTETERMGLIDGRVKEAVRVARRRSRSPKGKVLAYFWYKYQDRRDVYLSREDVVGGLREVLQSGADGYVIWGSSDDLRSRDKCRKFRDYLNEVLGPAVIETKELARQRILDGVTGGPTDVEELPGNRPTAINVA